LLYIRLASHPITQDANKAFRLSRAGGLQPIETARGIFWQDNLGARRSPNRVQEKDQREHAARSL
jgi:hypothetical protein